MYIICVVSGHDVLQFSGTAFAVNAKHVVTAFHNIYDKPTVTAAASSSTGTIYRDCVLVKSLDKENETVTYPDEQIRLRLVAYDEIDDWAVLERTDPHTFDDCIPVCSELELPQPSSDLLLTAYYAPLTFFNDELDLVKELKVWSERTSLLQYDKGISFRDQFAIVVSGKVQGASGSPIVTANGKAVAFHIDSFNEQTRTSRDDDSNAASGGKPKRAKAAKLTVGWVKKHVGEEVSDLKAEIDSTRSHADFSRAIVICRTPDLMRALGLS